VRPLPLRPAVTGLDLGVGNFQMLLEAHPDRLTLGEAILLTLRVQGTGPIERLRKPDLSSIAAVRRDFLVLPLADPPLKEHGVRLFCYELSPRTATVTGIPSIVYTCFDPERGVYQTRATAPLPLEVTPAEPEPSRPKCSPDQFRLIPPGVSLLTQDSVFPPASVIVVIYALPPCLFAVFWLLRRRSMSPIRPWGRAGRRALRALRAAPDESLREHAEAVHAALAGYLAERFGINSPEPEPREVKSLLHPPGINADKAALLEKVLADCAAYRFAPETDHAIENLKQRAAEAIQGLEEHA